MNQPELHDGIAATLPDDIKATTTERDHGRIKSCASSVLAKSRARRPTRSRTSSPACDISMNEDRSARASWWDCAISCRRMLRGSKVSAPAARENLAAASAAAIQAVIGAIL
jgi:hypothetical protein